ncbi:MAG: hypothetical protein J7559_23505 [Cohnella sp.]|nr:hypothetical protein [Cohnella sp.]
MRRMYPLLSGALLALLLAGCGADSQSKGATEAPKDFPTANSSLGIEPTVNTSSASPTVANSAETQQPPSNSDSASSEAQLKAAAQDVIEYLRERDLDALAPLIDSKLGLRFSPYPYMNTESDQVFQADALPDFKDSKKLKWGMEDGSGEPIELSFRDYYEKFVYNKDFSAAPSIGVNTLVSKGATTFNVADVYPNASFVEYHFPGFDTEMEGMDWQSLILVFIPAEGDWKLAAIVHGQWTI